MYTGLCVITLAYVYFCVGEVTGRTMEEINWFFMNGIPARKWREQPRPVIGNPAESGRSSKFDTEKEERVEVELSTP